MVTVTETVAVAVVATLPATAAAPTVAVVATPIKPVLIRPGASCQPGNVGQNYTVPAEGVRFVWTDNGNPPPAGAWIVRYGTSSGLKMVETPPQQDGNTWSVLVNGSEFAAAGDYMWQVSYTANGQPVASDRWCFRIEAAAPTDTPEPPQTRPSDTPEPPTPTNTPMPPTPTNTPLPPTPTSTPVARPTDPTATATAPAVPTASPTP